jgi:hypothetical protein
MEIYVIRKDGYKFQELDLEIDDFIENIPSEISYGTIHDFSQENLSLASFWKMPTTGFSEIQGERNFIPDITTWIGATLVLSPKAYRFLSDLLAPFGEFLPVSIEGEIYHIFNCLTLAETNFIGQKTAQKNIDDSKAKIVFKRYDQHCLDTYCSEIFKDAVESFDLRGIIFSSKDTKELIF